MKILVHTDSKQLRGGKVNPKTYPHWGELLTKLKQRGHEVQELSGILPWSQICEMVEWSDIGIDSDSFMQHLYWYNGKKCIVLFGQSDPIIFGHNSNVNLLKDRSYLRSDQFDIWESTTYNKDAFVGPDVVIEKLDSL
jgi:hypothetical protein